MELSAWRKGLTIPVRQVLVLELKCWCVHFYRSTSVDFSFGALIAEVKGSLYADKYSLRTLTQVEAIGWHLPPADVLLYGARDRVATNPGRTVMLPHNPCHLGFPFVGIRNGNIYIVLGRLTRILTHSTRIMQ